MAVRWGIVGVGVAGRARGRAILADPRSRLVAAVGGDPSALGLRPSPSLEAVIAHVDALAVCTPDDTHESIVCAALDAGLHVVCEFPLAQDAPAAQGLFDRARDRTRVLHVEHIELMSPAFRALQEIMGASPPARGDVQFEGTRGRGTASAFHRNVARLHPLWALDGPLDVLGALWEADCAHIDLCGRSGARYTCVFRHGPTLTRRAVMSLVTGEGAELRIEDGVLHADGRRIERPPEGSLFAADHELAMARIEGRATALVPAEVDVGVLAVCDRAVERAGRPW